MRPSILHGSVGSTLGFITCTLCGLKLQGPQKKLQSSPALHANIARCQEQEYAF
jgi:hypothetical protein